jgi:hypothetical protein
VRTCERCARVADEERDRSVEVARRAVLECIRLLHDSARDVYRSDPSWRRKALYNAHARILRSIELLGDANSALLFK